MSERIHPNDRNFKHRIVWERKLKIFPVPRLEINPFRRAFFRRYRWAALYCSNRRVLDIPCGMGWGTSLLSGAKSLTGADRDPEAIAEARVRYGSTARFEVADMQSFDFGAKAFEVICCLEGIEHVDTATAQNFLNRCAYSLEGKGYLLLTSPFRPDGRHSGNEFHIHEYQPQELLTMLEQNFSARVTEEYSVGELKVLYIEAQKKVE